MKELENLIDRMDPEAAMAALAGIVRKLFPQVGESSQLNFVYALTGGAEEGSAADLVHL